MSGVFLKEPESQVSSSREIKGKVVRAGVGVVEGSS